MTDAINHARPAGFFELDAAALDHQLFQTRDQHGAYRSSCQIVVDGSTYNVSLGNDGLKVKRTLASALKHFFFGNKAAAVKAKIANIETQLRERLDSSRQAARIVDKMKQNFFNQTPIAQNSLLVADAGVFREVENIQTLGKGVALPEGGKFASVTPENLATYQASQVKLMNVNDLVPNTVNADFDAAHTLADLVRASRKAGDEVARLPLSFTDRVTTRLHHNFDLHLKMAKLMDGVDLTEKNLAVTDKRSGHVKPMLDSDTARKNVLHFVQKNWSPNLGQKFSEGQSSGLVKSVVSLALMTEYVCQREGIDRGDALDLAIRKMNELMDPEERVTDPEQLAALKEDALTALRDVLRNNCERQIAKIAIGVAERSHRSVFTGITAQPTADPQPEGDSLSENFRPITLSVQRYLPEEA